MLIDNENPFGIDDMDPEEKKGPLRKRGDASVAPKGKVKATGLSKVHWRNEGLTTGGEPVETDISRNRQRYGYTCPREEYVTAEVPLTMRELAKKWSVSQKVITEWSHNGKWTDERRRFWTDINRLRLERDKEVIAEVQSKELDKQRMVASMLRDTLLGMLQRGTVKEQTATGKEWERPINFRDMKDASATFESINKTIERTLGISDIILRAGGKPGDNDAPPVTHVIMNMHVTGTPNVEIHEVIEGKTTELPSLPPSSEAESTNGS